MLVSFLLRESETNSESRVGPGQRYGKWKVKDWQQHRELKVSKSPEWSLWIMSLHSIFLPCSAAAIPLVWPPCWNSAWQNRSSELQEDFQALLLVFTELIIPGPSYLSDLLLSDRASQTLRSSSTSLFIIPGVQTQTRGKAAFSRDGQPWWSQTLEQPARGHLDCRDWTVIFSKEAQESPFYCGFIFTLNVNNTVYIL